MELKCITELVSCRNTGKTQKIFYGWMNYYTCRDILIYLALFYNFLFLCWQGSSQEFSLGMLFLLLSLEQQKKAPNLWL